MALWRSLGTAEVEIGGFAGLHEHLAPANRPLNVLSRVSNLRIGPAPALSTRQGLTCVGEQRQGPIRGLHRYQNLSGTTVQLLAGFGAQLMRYDPATGVWTSVGTLADSRWTAANIASSSDFAVFFMGDTPKKWNGSTLTNLNNAPKGRYVVEAYQQLFVGGIVGRENDLDFCDVALPEVWSPKPTNDAGSITVSNHPIKWVGFDKVQGKVLIWTTQTVEQLNGPETPNRPGLWAVRTVCQEGTQCGFTVQNLAGTWIWLGDDAFCLWSGSTLQKAVEPIAASFALIDWARIDDASSWVTQDGEYVCCVPRVGGGVLWFVFNPAVGWFTGTGPEITAFAMYEFGGRMQTVVGSTDGRVFMIAGDTDDGKPIDWSVEIGPTVLGSAFEKKHLLAVDVLLTSVPDAEVYAAVSDVEEGDVWSLPHIFGGQEHYGVLRIPLPPLPRSNVFRLKLWGTGKTTIHDVRLRFATGRS